MQVAVRATGICGSDLHYYNHFRNGDILVREPLSLGHESSGEIVAVGNDVSGLKIGDRVALEVGLPCGKCDRCAEGRYNICTGMRFRSSAKSFPHAQGTLQDRINHPADWCHLLPPSMPWDVSALLEPLSVAIHAARRAALSPSASVLIFGAGAVGLLVAGVCKIYGANTVIIADVDPGRVKFAIDNKFADASFVVPIRPRPSSTEEALQAAKELAGEIVNCRSHNGVMIGEVDTVFECTGVPSCVQTAIYVSRLLSTFTTPSESVSHQPELLTVSDGAYNSVTRRLGPAVRLCLLAWAHRYKLCHYLLQP